MSIGDYAGKQSLGNFCISGNAFCWQIGDKCQRTVDGKVVATGIVGGFVIGKDGRKCLLLHLKRGGTYLCPVDEAKEPETLLDVLRELSERSQNYTRLSEVTIAEYAARVRRAVDKGI